MIERITVEAMVAVDIEEGLIGLWFATSPMVKGLLVVEHTRHELLSKIPGAITALAMANMDPEAIELQRAAQLDELP